MPYRRRTYKKPAYKKRSNAPAQRAVVRTVRREIRREDLKDHPLQWKDVKWTGDYVKTTPSLLSFGLAIENQIDATGEWVSWPSRYDSISAGSYHQANVHIMGYHYQLRFQQNAEAVDVTTNTVRDLFYSFDDTYSENGVAILNGGDIDMPPHTDNVRSMYSDKMRTLKAQITEIGTDDSQMVEGQAILKGYKKLNHKLVMKTAIGGGTVTTIEGGDVRHEMQSDDNSIVGEVQVYGFVRIYYRIMN